MSNEYPVNLLPPDPGDLMGSLNDDFINIAPLRSDVYAAAGTLGLMAGVCGRSYMTHSDAGLNQYIMVVGSTGTGKDSISHVTSKMFAGLSPLGGGSAGCVAGFEGFRGPGELVSSAGLIKWMAKNPCVLSILGEVGLFFNEMTKPNAPAHLKSLLRVLLQFYSKSGHGNTFDPAAYSDQEKVTAAIKSPSLTIVGETTPSTLYEGFSERNVISGLLPRLAIFENAAPRPPRNENARERPSDLTLRLLGGVGAHCLGLGHRGVAERVRIAENARRHGNDFAEHARLCINASGEEVRKQLWNRAELKAMKFAALPAISRNFLNPEVILSDVEWATNLINHQIVSLIGKFERDEVGVVDGDEAKQRATVIRIIFEYVTQGFDNFRTYGCVEEMHSKNVITHSYIAKRTAAIPAFKNDRVGATAALKRTLQRLLEDDDLREMASMQTSATFGTKAKSYVVSNSKTFGIEPLKVKRVTDGPRFF